MHTGVTEVVAGFALPESGHLTDADLGKYVVRLRRAIDAASRVREIKRDDEARAMWREVYPALSEGAPGLLGAMTSRAEAHVMRLSALYALMDEAKWVHRQHLEAALALWEYCEESARFIFGSALGDPLADELIRLLRANPDGLSQTDMYNHFGRHKSSEQIARALALIAEQGLADTEKQTTAGRTATIWKATGGAQKAQEAQKAIYQGVSRAATMRKKVSVSVVTLFAHFMRARKHQANPVLTGFYALCALCAERVCELWGDIWISRRKW